MHRHEREKKRTASHLGVDVGAALLGVLEALQHHHARALAHHEAAAVLVEGAGALVVVGVVIGVVGMGMMKWCGFSC